MRALLTLIGLATGVASLASDWPQFRGPNGRAVASDTGLPAVWECPTR